MHRVVRPANVVIEDGTGRPVLLDFGLARPRDLAGRRGPAFVRYAVKAAELALPRTQVCATIAGSGLEALACARRAAPDVIVLDYDMPALNGGGHALGARAA